MKAMLVLVGLLACFGATLGKSEYEKQIELIPLQQRILEDTINDTINSVVALIKPYDPANVESSETTILGIHGLVENVQAEGFSNIYASHIYLSGLFTWTFEITINVPHVSVSVGRWLVEGSDIFWGDGSISAEVNDVSLSLTAEISILSIAISDVTVTPHVGGAQVSVTGIKNDEQLSQEVTDWINTFLNETLNSSWNLHEWLADLVQQAIDWVIDWIGL